MSVCVSIPSDRSRPYSVQIVGAAIAQPAISAAVVRRRSGAALLLLLLLYGDFSL